MAKKKKEKEEKEKPHAEASVETAPVPEPTATLSEPTEAVPPPTEEKATEFIFRGRLTGLKTQVTKEGTVKVLELKTKMLHELRDLDPLMEHSFDVTMILTWGYRQDAQNPVKPPDESQKELPGMEPGGEDAGGDGAGGEDAGDTAPEPGAEGTSERDLTGYTVTEYVCDPEKGGCGNPLYAKDGEPQLIFCLTDGCKMPSWANPDYAEPEE